MFFTYSQQELDYLKSKDKTLGKIIEKIGLVQREVQPDLFSAVVFSIIGQQISTKAHLTIWQRFKQNLGTVDAFTINQQTCEQLQALGISYRKVSYIKDFAAKVVSGEFSVEKIQELEDKEAIEALITLKGIGVWTAEMILLFCLQRKDILSFDDLAIQRGLRMIYRHRKLTKEQFLRYKKRYSPYGSVASLYIWAVAGGAIAELSDPAPKNKKATNGKTDAKKAK